MEAVWQWIVSVFLVCVNFLAGVFVYPVSDLMAALNMAPAAQAVFSPLADLPAYPTEELVFEMKSGDAEVYTTADLLAAKSSAAPGSTVWLHGGTYALSAKLSFTAADTQNVTYAAVPGEEAVITGSVPLTGFAEDTINGVACFSVPYAADCTSLYHPTEQLQRPRYPESGYLLIDKPIEEITDHYHSHASSFQAKSCDARTMASFSNPSDITLRILHFWKDEIAQITGIDTESNAVTFDRPSAMSVNSDQRYFLENVREMCNAPGEWYLDRAEQKLYYVPFAGETADTLVLQAAVVEQLLLVDGCNGIEFNGIQFRDTAWSIHAAQDTSQAAVNLWPCVEVQNSTRITFANCTFENIGATALRFTRNVQDSSIVRCAFSNIGGTAIWVHGANLAANHSQLTRNISVTDNTIHGYGRQFFNAIGIHLTYARNVDIGYNEIHDGYYTAISSGWNWGYSTHPTDYIDIHHNRIYDIGQGWLSDMGGIYTLGVQYNSRLYRNVINNVSADPDEGGYGGWGIYLDEGTSGMLVEQNLVWDCGSNCFHQHYGKENILRFNIFALTKGEQLMITRKEEHSSFCLWANVIVSDGYGMYLDAKKDQFKDYNNLYYDYSAPGWIFFGEKSRFPRLGVTEMLQRGYLGNFLQADPLFQGGRKSNSPADFVLADNSPALQLATPDGLRFSAWDYREAGPRD
ncbi:MAG: right-handed parallel beta-helix repeat-containing protein [Oscillospiraceae bacterium]|nr:right-handed parallel beta-helix repeat-containing protein [Oscillospiraceae bacterium]